MIELITKVMENPLAVAGILILIFAISVWLISRNASRAQALINNQHEKLSNKVDVLEQDKATQAVAFAEERGGLNAKINQLERNLKREQRTSSVRSDQNKERIASLERELDSMRTEQKKLLKQYRDTQKERDDAKVALAHKELELDQVRKQVEGLIQQINALTDEVNQLRQKIQDKDAQLKTIVAKLEGQQS